MKAWRVAGFLVLGIVAAVLALLGTPNLVEAHTRSFSTSSWRFEGAEGTVRFELQVTNLAETIVGRGLETGSIGPAQLAQMRRGARERVLRGVSVVQNGERCDLHVRPEPARLVDRFAVVGARVVCPAPPESEGARLRIDLLPELGAQHTHLVRLRAGAASLDRALGGGYPTLEVGPRAHAGGSSALSFLWLGVVHIGTGVDHVLFLITLLFAVWLTSSGARGLFRDLLVTATAFTAGHSVTLALAVTGVARPAGEVVELLIAASIAVLAVEVLAATEEGPVSRVGGLLLLAALPLLALAGWMRVPVPALLGLALFAAAYLEWVRCSPRPARLRCAVAGVFGLVHGFGFAGVLLDLDLSGLDLAVALLCFNLGVELGQALLLGLLAVAVWTVHGTRYRLVLSRGAASATFMAACWWMGARG